MGYAVCHRDASGTLQVDDVASLEAAVELVERLRNDDGPADVRVFREIPIEVRTYYKVVIADEDGVASSTGSPLEATAATEVVPPAPPTGGMDELPGAFPLSSPAVPPGHETGDTQAPGDGHRRPTRFGRGG